MTVLKRTIKNQDYSRLLGEEGSRIPCDKDANYEMKLPAWANRVQLKKAQLFFFLNLNANIRGILLGLLQIIPEQTIFQILEFTKQSATPTAAYRRYRATSLHGATWGQSDLTLGSKSWRSLEYIRKIHFMISKRAEKQGLGIISQKDMAITQFAFVGIQLSSPEKLGIIASRNDLENFCHDWRVRGAMLGIEDRFNICGATLDETLSRIDAIKFDFVLPALIKIDPKVENYLRIAVEGMKGFEPWLDVDTQIFTAKRLAGVPTYGFFKQEANSSNVNRAFDKLSFYSRFRISTDVIIFDFLSKVLLFRICFNIFRILFSVFDYFPVFAIWKFGRKYANVKVLNTKPREK